MMDLTKLVSVLQTAKEGSEYLDYSIQRLFGTAKPVPLYTRSLDAALHLLPEGWTIHRLSHIGNCRGSFAGWIGEVYRASDAMIPFPADGAAATAPLAICIAALRIRLSQAPTLAEPELLGDPPKRRSGM